MEESGKTQTPAVQITQANTAAAPAEAAVPGKAAAEARPGEPAEILARKEQEILALKTDLAGLASRVKNLGGALGAAAESYRALAVQANPDILPELISGTSVAEIEASVKRAREIVARVKKGVETELSRDRFPAGAPERGGSDTGLTPREKIQQGISRN